MVCVWLVNLVIDLSVHFYYDQSITNFEKKIGLPACLLPSLIIIEIHQFAGWINVGTEASLAYPESLFQIPLKTHSRKRYFHINFLLLRSSVILPDLETNNSQLLHFFPVAFWWETFKLWMLISILKSLWLHWQHTNMRKMKRPLFIKNAFFFSRIRYEKKKCWSYPTAQHIGNSGVDTSTFLWRSCFLVDAEWPETKIAQDFRSWVDRHTLYQTHHLKLYLQSWSLFFWTLLSENENSANR